MDKNINHSIFTIEIEITPKGDGNPAAPTAFRFLFDY